MAEESQKSGIEKTREEIKSFERKIKGVRRIMNGPPLRCDECGRPFEVKAVGRNKLRTFHDKFDLDKDGKPKKKSCCSECGLLLKEDHGIKSAPLLAVLNEEIRSYEDEIEARNTRLSNMEARAVRAAEAQAKEEASPEEATDGVVAESPETEESITAATAS